MNGFNGTLLQIKLIEQTFMINIAEHLTEVHDKQTQALHLGSSR